MSNAWPVLLEDMIIGFGCRNCLAVKIAVQWDREGQAALIDPSLIDMMREQAEACCSCDRCGKPAPPYTMCRECQWLDSWRSMWLGVTVCHYLGVRDEYVFDKIEWSLRHDQNKLLELLGDVLLPQNWG